MLILMGILDIWALTSILRFFKAQLEKSAAYEKTLGELAVQKMAQQASLSSISAQLGEQNSDALEYAMTDNPSVQKIHNTIVEKETEVF